MDYPKMVTSYQQTRYNVTKCSNRKTGKKVKYIVIHYTGTTASAKNNCIYFSGGNRNASADYFIDKDGVIYKFNADTSNYYSWHCGDGKGKYGITNANSIGIEVVSAGEVFTSAQIVALTKLVNAIQSEYGVLDSNIVRHYDASRKMCPAPYCGTESKDSSWKSLWKTITGTSASSVLTESAFTVRVTATSLNIRKGPGTNHPIVGIISDKGVYTITEVKDNWGKLKSGVGWISLKYAEKITTTVRVTASELNIRKGPGVGYEIVGRIKDKGTYTITEVKDDWGKLKSGAGWISLNYTTYSG